jgi:hypothetical protein
MTRGRWPTKSLMNWKCVLVGEGGENYYDDRGNNYFQGLIVCIGCKAFIRRIIRTAACTTIYLLFTNCHSNPRACLQQTTPCKLYVFVDIRQHHSPKHTVYLLYQHSVIISAAAEYTSVRSHSCGLFQTSVFLALDVVSVSPNTFVEIFRSVDFNPLVLELDIYSLAHNLCKMWLLYEPKRVTLRNRRHFIEE